MSLPGAQPHRRYDLRATLDSRNIRLLLVDALNLIRRVYAAQPGPDATGSPFERRTGCGPSPGNAAAGAAGVCRINAAIFLRLSAAASAAIRTSDALPARMASDTLANPRAS